MKLEDLCGDSLDNKKTAFYGRVGWESFDLYLITYEGISMAAFPNRTWSAPGCMVYVNRFVDVFIIAEEREKDE